MKKHLGKRLFITGIPTTGKSYLAKKLAEELGGVAVLLDNHREVLGNDERYKKWVEFYWNKDEKQYYSETPSEEQWKNLVDQSEALWPGFLEKINSYSEETKPVIFECVNMLPHFASQDLYFPGIVLVGDLYEKVLERNIAEPRWGATKELQEMEAKSFFFIERPRYIKEAERYGLQIFNGADDSYESAKKLLAD
jgi:2-phosphoglycerate kinase